MYHYSATNKITTEIGFIENWLSITNTQTCQPNFSKMSTKICKMLKNEYKTPGAGFNQDPAKLYLAHRIPELQPDLSSHFNHVSIRPCYHSVVTQVSRLIFILERFHIITNHDRVYDSVVFMSIVIAD